MEHYPDIQRQQGTLFFIPHGDSAAIAMSIERLIDLLDAAEGDPDIEANGDERDQSYLDDHLHRHALCPLEDDEPYLGWPNACQRANCEMSCDLDREEDGADQELDHDGEASLGWTNALDQTAPSRIGDVTGSDREVDGDEQDCSRSEDEWSPNVPGRADYDGSGTAMAKDMIRGLPIAAKRADAYALAGVPILYRFERIAR